jgi:hypothetical protein
MKKKRTKPTVSRHDVETACDIFLSRLGRRRTKTSANAKQ